MNYKMIRYIIGNLLCVEGALILLPAVTAIIYGESLFFVFFAVALGSFLLGYLLRFKKPANTKIYAAEGYVAVALCWIVMSIFGALPLYFSGFYNHPIDALFEIVSGFTTTGATVISDVEALPKSIQLWRSLSHWIGGMGVLVFILAILPVAGASSMYLMRAESPGPDVGKLVPKVKHTAAILYRLYIALTFLEILLLMIAGATLFEAINLSFSTAGTGGFGLLNDSAGSYSSAIQIILTVFMILFGVNFNVYFLIYSRKLKDAFKCEEVRVYLGIIVIAAVLIGISIYPTYHSAKAFLDSSFQVATIITTTGFSTANFDLWPEFAKTIMVILMFVGACAGSTGGGMKVSRIILMGKTIVKELHNITHPRTVRKVRLEGKPVEHEVIRSTNVYVMAYIGIFVVSLLLISLNGRDAITNFTSVAATLNNVGPGLAQVGPVENFSSFSNLSKIVFIFDMLAGRLELFPMLVLCSPGLWKKRWH